MSYLVVAILSFALGVIATVRISSHMDDTITDDFEDDYYFWEE